ncbi:DUF4826 family protein [Aliikangiella marina]|uniref:DUF4826 family protein n=1 Tax=Aliikangiella marina TaxID=1712262 RepID=A0A545TIX2_9GAMM|nr:DUF4826 family protein [Aliikangiella marina]TQV77163.1 DUF4826 family protein [Aliikangiella marina]
MAINPLSLWPSSLQRWVSLTALHEVLHQLKRRKIMTQSQTNSATPNPMTPEEREAMSRKWGQEEVVKIQKFCFSNGIEFKSFKQDRCLCIPPVIGIWYVTSKTKEDYWVVSGEMPTDLAPASVAANAREALRYFSMSWHLKAAKMEDSLAEGKVQLGDKETQQKAIAELITKANTLATLHQDDKLWAESELKIA